MGIQIQLGTVNTCNAKCHFCIYPRPENTYAKGVMDMALFRKIVDEVGIIPEIDCVSFSALGEPLLDRFLVERVRYTRETRSDINIELYTNGTGLTPAKFDALRDAGLKYVSISLNASNPAQHERIMGLKGMFGKVVSHAKYAIENGQGKTEVLVKAVRNDDQFDEIDTVKFYNTWGVRAKSFPEAAGVNPGVGVVVNECNWAGRNRLIKLRTLDPDSTCGRAMGQINVLWDGKVTMCCNDPLNKFPLGDLKTQTIKEVYNSGKYVTFRQDHFENRASKYDLCKVCTRV